MESRKNRKNRMIRKNKGIILVCTIVCLLIGLMGIAAYIRDRQLKDQFELRWAQYKTEEENAKMLLTAECKPLSVSDGLITYEDGDGKILLEPETFLKTASRKSGKGSDISQIDCYLEEKVHNTDLLILEFQAHTTKQYVDMVVKCGTVENIVTVGPVPSQYYIPIVGQNTLYTVSFRQEYPQERFDAVSVGNVRLINYGDSYEVTQLRTGQYELGNFEAITIESERNILEKADKLLISDNYLFHLKAGTIKIFDKATNQLVSSVSGLGETRDMCFTMDQKALVVVSRGSGTYIVSIADVTEPTVLSHYDSLGLSTGLDVKGEYAYIANRYFGIEIVNIRDLRNPRFVAQIQPKKELEYQDCLVEDGILYVSVYAEQRMDIYDVRDFGDIQLISSINLGAFGQGSAVKENILVVTTAMVQGDSYSEELTAYGKGAGNGMQIYDVSDPATPKLLSKVQLDGRLFSYSGIDEWDVELSGDFALVCGMGCGLYVYDISNPELPVRREVYNVVAKPTSSKYIEKYDIDQSFPPVYPYNTDLERRGWVTGIAVEKDRAWLLTYDMGIYEISADWCTAADKTEAWTPKSAKTAELEVPELDGYQVAHSDFDGSVWAVCEISDSVLAVAAGEAGIQLITKDMACLTQLNTRYSVKDIKYQNGFLYAAESEGGLGIYQIENDNMLNEVGRFVEPVYNSCFSSLMISPVDDFAVAQTAANRYVIIDISDKTKPVSMKNPTNDDVGNLYYRTLSTGAVGGKYIGIIGQSGVNWFYSEDSTIKYLEDTSGRVGYENQGLAVAGEYCIQISTNGYRYWDPEEGIVSENHVMSADWFDGKAVAEGDKLVVTRNYDGRICIVDVENIDNPRITACLDLGCAIDVACITEDAIWIPCRNNGLLKLEAIF